MPFASNEEVTLYYEVHGNGAPLLLISGLAGGSWSWCCQIPFFKDHYRTIVFDNRGAGQSSMPPGPYRMADLAQDALSVLNHLEVEQGYVMGLSMGGMIAQELALLAPGRIRAIVLGCTHCGGDLRVSPPPDVLQTLVTSAALPQEEMVRRNLPLFLSKECLETRHDVVEAFCRNQMAVTQQAEYAFQAQLAAIRSFNSADRLSRLEMPALIVTGTNDSIVPSENAGILARRIRHAELAHMSGAAHALHFECAAPLNRLAHEFFLRHPMKNGRGEIR